jgi:beta-lactamase regulating signal transducer with metallopeptidase domain
MSGVGFLTGSVSQAVGWALLHLVWQGAAIAVLLATVLALMEKRSANARYLVSCAALGILLTAGALTAVRSYRGADVSAKPAQVRATGVAASSTALDATPATALLLTSSNEPSFEWRPFLQRHLPEIVLLWMIGVALLSLRLVGSWVRALSLTVGALPASAEWQRTLRRLAASLQLRRVVSLVESAAVEVPTVIGWIRPVILLPLSTMAGLSTEQIEMVLAHEIAHIRRHDFLVNLLQAVAETVLFYHPAVWWMSRRVRIEREHCCDDLAVAVCGNALQYARALTRLEELRAGNAQAVLAANGGSLLSRVRRLVGARGEAASNTPRWIAGTTVLTSVVLALAFASTPLLAQREVPPVPPAPPAPVVLAPPVATPVPPAPPAPAHSIVEVRADGSTYWRQDADSEQVQQAMMAVAAADEASQWNQSDASTPTPAIAPLAIEAPVVEIDPSDLVAPRALVEPGRILKSVSPALSAKIARAMAAGTPRPAIWSRERRHIGESGKLTVDDLITLRSAGVTPQYVQQMRALGLGELSLDDIVDLRAIGITPEEVGKLRGAGLGTLSVREITSLRAVGVTTDYLNSLRASGVTIATAKDAMSLRAVGVTPEFVKALSDAGYTNLSVHDLLRLRSNGVSADFVRDMARYRSTK